MSASETPVNSRLTSLFALLPIASACTHDTKHTVLNDAPEVQTQSPVEGGSVLEGASVVLTGTVSDVQDGVENLFVEWLVAGTPVCAGVVPAADGAVSCETALSADALIELKAKDPRGATGEDSVSVVVETNAPPTIALVAPSADLSYYVDLPVGFEVTTGDDRDDPAALTIAWTDNDAPLTLGGSPDSDGTWTGSTSLADGDHVLKATVTDTGGKTASATVTITVYEENTIPECGFVAPAVDSCFEADDTIVFEGTSRDEQTAPDRLSVALSSSLDGSLDDALTPTTTGTWTYAATGLSAGTHSVTLTVQDDYGDRCVETLLVEVADTVWYRDQDGDGYGDPGDSEVSCAAPEGFVEDGEDYDDNDAFTYPGAARFESASDCMTDADGDGYGASLVVAGATAGTDCDDSESATSPAASEVCDEVDNDCDGTVDNGVTTTFYADSDSDGYGALGTTTEACSVPTGFVTDATDCDDSNTAVNPGATEVCDAADVDEDCSGTADDADSGVDASTYTTWYADSDSDAYGDPSTTQAACDAPTGFVADDTDCDDSAAAVNPGATEVCDAADVDEDCSGTADDADSGVDLSTQSTFYADSDADTYGDATVTTDACELPSGYVTDDSDCDDSASAVNLGVTEVCDAADVDEDCSGTADDADSGVDPSTFTTWYADSDGDGEGDAATTTATCDAPSAHVENSTDCDDTDATVGLTATEICDSQDNDCDTLVDDADSDLDTSTASTWYADVDADGYGDAAVTSLSCAVPSGFVSDNTDCDDTFAYTYPGATELCDGTQNDCDDTTWTDDAGLVSFETDLGVWSDDTTTWAAGISALPASISLSSDGTAHVCEGTWYVSLDVSANVEVIGEDGSADVVLSGGGNDTVVELSTGGVTVGLSDLTVQEGLGTSSASAASTVQTYGGGVFCDVPSGLELTRMVFDQNTAERGGAAFAGSNCTVTATDVTWTANSSEAGGAAFALGADWDEVNGAYIGNEVDDYYAGALYFSSADGSCVDCTFDANAATASNAGAVLVTNGIVDLSGSSFTNNTTTGSAGAIWVRFGADVTIGAGGALSGNAAGVSGGAALIDAGGVLTVDDSTFTNNTAPGDGGAIYNNGGALALGALTIATGNSAGEQGGAVYLKGGGSVDLDTAEVSSNTSAADGGAIYVEGGCTLTIADSDLDGNTTTGSGGSVHSYGDVVISGAFFTSNMATSQGGALYLAAGGSLDVSDTTFDSNQATDSGSDSGAIHLRADATIDTCTFTDNYAADDGGVMYVQNGATVDITDSDFDGNSASSSGGSILSDASFVNITGGSFTDNTAAWGGAIYDYDSTGLITADDVTFDGNEGVAGGGAGMSYAGGRLSISNSTFSSNNATGSSADGGAFLISSGGTLLLDTCTLEDNSASDQGGGIVLVGNGASATLTDTDVTSNLATYGGGVSLGYLGGYPTLTLTRGSVTSNVATTDGGGILNGGNVTANSVNMGGTNTPSDTEYGAYSGNWGTSASFTCTPGGGCN